jgi:hypothetical protein
MHLEVLWCQPNTEDSMRFVVTTAAAATLIAVSAFAQNYGGATQPATPNASTATTNTNNTTAQGTTGTTANRNGPSNPAVKTKEGNNPGAPVAGANSFTEGQAKARIQARGYANVSGLAKDTNGFWRGTAMKDGKSVNVTLDYQGNVTVN